MRRPGWLLSLFMLALILVSSGCSDDALQLPQMVEEISLFRGEYHCDQYSDYVIVYAVARVEGQPYLVPLSVPMGDSCTTALEAALHFLSNPPQTPGIELEWPLAGYRLTVADDIEADHEPAVVVVCNEGKHYGAAAKIAPLVRESMSGEHYRLVQQLLAYTLTEFDNIDAVVFSSDQVSFERSENPLNGVRGQESHITVYYQLKGTDYLVPVSIQSSPDRNHKIRQALDCLFKEPAGLDGLQSVFESGCAVSYYESGNVLYIDLDYRLLLAVINGRTNAGKALEAVTATLTNIENVEKVQVLVNGKVVGSLGSSGLDLSVPLTRLWVNRLLP